jgi:ketosteroid isomerase-like protein
VRRAQPDTQSAVQRSGPPHPDSQRSEREATIVRLFRIIDRCEWPSLCDVFHDDVTYERPGYGTFVGIDALRHFYCAVRIIESGTHVIEGVVCSGLEAASWGEFVGVSRHGEPLQERFADVYRFSGDKIIRRRSHFFRPAV